MTSIHQDLSTIVFNFCLYAGGHLFFSKAWKYALGPSYSKLNKSDRISFSEKVSSTVHASYVSLLAAKIIFIDGAYSKDTLETYPLAAHKLFLHYTGYNIYDIITMAMQGDQHWSMWLHHIMGLYGASLMLYFKKPSFYPFIFFLSESTAIPNNLCWYAQKFQSSPRTLTLLQVLRALSFIIARVWIGPYAMYRALHQAHFNVFELWSQWTTQLHPVAMTLTLLNLILLSYLNVGWTIATIKLALRALGLRKKSAALKKVQ